MWSYFMEDLFYLAVGLLPCLVIFGVVGAIVDWQVERKRRREEVPLKHYPEPKFRERIGGEDTTDKLF